MTKIQSPNNWLVKAGARMEGNQLILPLNCLLVPMGVASDAITDFRNSNNLKDRIKFGAVAAIMTRVADTAYFRNVAKMLMERNPENNVAFCEHCLRGQLWDTKIKEYRKLVNKDIIHKMEEDMMINPDDLKYVELYYEEMFKHPLTNPISWGNVTMQSCNYCKKKNN
jgi:hypothetical protein